MEQSKFRFILSTKPTFKEQQQAVEYTILDKTGQYAK